MGPAAVMQYDGVRTTHTSWAPVVFVWTVRERGADHILAIQYHQLLDISHAVFHSVTTEASDQIPQRYATGLLKGHSGAD